MTRTDTLFGATALIGIAAICAALVSQYVYGVQPCAWCVLQRLIFCCITAAALIGLLWRARAGRLAGATLGIALAACGVAAALWQHFVAAPSNSCNLSLAERIISALGLDETLPQLFMALASCAEAAVKLLGVPYEFWSLALFARVAALLSSVLRQQRA